MILVILESPYAGYITLNVAYARLAVRDALRRGEAPICSHLLYTQRNILRDSIPEERQLGIDAGLAWGRVADKTVVYVDLGISKGMQYGIENAEKAGRPVEYRRLFTNFVVGLTGGIASGKSTVAQLFKEQGIPIIDTDKISHQLTEPGQHVLSIILEEFPSVKTETGALNRQALRDLIFEDKDAREKLENIIHPAIVSEMYTQINKTLTIYAIADIPLLVEKNLKGLVDHVLVIDCDEELQLSRLQARDGSTLDQARKILSAQATRKERRFVSDTIIHNDGDIESLRANVINMHNAYQYIARRRIEMKIFDQYEKLNKM